MKDWNAPSIVAQTLLQCVLSEHVCFGIVVWEYFSHIKFDVELCMGRRCRPWTFWIYTVCRLSPIVEFCILLSGLDMRQSDPDYCHMAVIAQLAFAAISFLSVSSLMLIRAVALWKMNRAVIAVSTVILLATMGLIMRTLAIMKGASSPFVPGCVILKPWSPYSLATYSVFLTTELITATLTFSGLYQYKRLLGDPSGLWKMLYHQGALWILLAIISDVPAIIMLVLNLNGPMDMIVVAPTVIIMPFGATRMYRSLHLRKQDLSFCPELSTTFDLHHDG